MRSDLTDAMYTHRVVSKILGVTDVVGSFFGMVIYAGYTNYDPMWLRLEHCLLNTMVVFKDESLSEELRSHYINETKKMLEIIRAYTGSHRFKITQLFWGTIMRVVSRGSTIDGFRTAGLSNDYDILQRLTNGLVKNPLAFHAARLKSL